MPTLPSWLTEPLWDQFTALLPHRDEFDPTHPLGCHRRRIADRIVFDKLLQVLRFGCLYEGIADSTCSRPPSAIVVTSGSGSGSSPSCVGSSWTPTTASSSAAARIAVDGAITKAPGGEVAGPSPVDRRKQG